MITNKQTNNVSVTILIGQNWFQCGRTSIWWRCSASLVPQFLICLRVTQLISSFVTLLLCRSQLDPLCLFCYPATLSKSTPSLLHRYTETDCNHFILPSYMEILQALHLNAVAGKSVSHHHHHSAWQRSERWQVYRDTGMMEMEKDWVTGAYGDAGVMEMGCATGSIYSGDPGVDRSHLISSYHTTNYTLYLFPTFALTRSF